MHSLAVRLKFVNVKKEFGTSKQFVCSVILLFVSVFFVSELQTFIFKNQHHITSLSRYSGLTYI